jgi:hypothetical protein
MIEPRLAGIAEAALELIGVFAQIVEQAGRAGLLSCSKGSGEIARALGHAEEVLTQ